jgi:hypothetical protein
MTIDYDVVKDLYESLYGQVSLAPALFNRLVNSATNYFVSYTGVDFDVDIPDDVYVAVVDMLRAMIHGDFKREKIGDYSYDRGETKPLWRQILEQYRGYKE